jgi:hypothetical protein
MIANAVVRSVVVASAVQIGYLCTLPTSEDLLNSIWHVVVCGQVVQVTSIMTSTIPFLKPFLVSLESGFLGASKATHSTASAFDSTGDMGHPSIYIRIGSQKGGSCSKGTDQQSDIWVTKDVFIKREPNSAQAKR